MDINYSINMASQSVSHHQLIKFILIIVYLDNLTSVISGQNIQLQSQRSSSNLLGCHIEIIVDESLTNHFKYKYSDR